MEYSCKYCSKVYKSTHSRSNHYRIYHKEEISQNSVKSKSNTSQISVKSKSNLSQILINNELFKCNFCDNTYKHNQSKWKHEKKCKNKTNQNAIDIIKKKYDDLKKENIEIKEMLSNILKECKIHPKTLQKINKNLINSNNNNNITNNTNNGTINTINIVKFGSEDLASILSQTEILKILNRQRSSLEESIKLTHFNKKRPELKNIYITNLKDQYAYIFDGSKFIAVLKTDVLNELVDNHFENIELSVEEYKDKLNSKTIDVLDKFIEKINDEDEEFTDMEHNKTYPSYKNFKVNQIKLMIYNESENRSNIVNVICERIPKEKSIDMMETINI
jgi:hypothetical protein